MLHFKLFEIEYGYEYVGLQNNFLIMPDNERMYLSFAHAINYKNPLHIYRLNNGTKKETLKVFAIYVEKELIIVRLPHILS